MLSCNEEAALLLDPPNEESQSTLKFLNSLQELKELRSQIQTAADYCESAFKLQHAQEKKTVMEETREYICRAVVAVVDHLGCVSANLGSAMNQADRVTQAQLRINCLQQRVVLHGEYNRSVGLSRLSRRLVVPPPTHFSRYILPPSNQYKSEEHPRQVCLLPNFIWIILIKPRLSQLEGCVKAESKKKQKHRIEQDLPLFMYTSTDSNTNSSSSNNYSITLYKSPSMKDSQLNTLQSLDSVLPVRDELSNPEETKVPAFHFQMVRKHGRRIMQWRIQDKDILSLIRRRKKESLKFLNF